MAAITVNSAIPARYNIGGGTLTINDGADTATIKNIEAGTLTITPNDRAVDHYTDQGVAQPPLEGEDVNGRVSITVKFAGADAAKSMMALLQTVSTNGLRKEFIVIADIPNFRGSAAGHRYTATSCNVVTGGLRYRQGDRFDYLELELEVRAGQWSEY